MSGEKREPLDIRVSIHEAVNGWYASMYDEGRDDDFRVIGARDVVLEALRVEVEEIMARADDARAEEQG